MTPKAQALAAKPDGQLSSDLRSTGWKDRIYPELSSDLQGCWHRHTYEQIHKHAQKTIHETTKEPQQNIMKGNLWNGEKYQPNHIRVNIYNTDNPAGQQW